MYLYLTTKGRVTGQRREIEIWFTEHGGHFYLVAESASANWVRNIQSQPQVEVRVDDAEFNAIARVVPDDREPQLAATVKALFDAKYGWSRRIADIADRGLGPLSWADCGPSRENSRVQEVCWG
jgi:deazaflavin-dependent oxidoreductase (nitroreductase family)